MSEDAKQVPPIPPVVMELAASQWEQGAHSDLFTSALTFRPQALSDPSVYLFRRGEAHSSSFSGDEAFKLHEQGAFGGLSSVDANGTLRVNEHALHAVEDFISKTSAHWREYLSRLDSVKRRG